MIRHISFLTCFLLATACHHSASADDSFDSTIVPFLKQHCVRCHGPKNSEARLSLHKMTSKIGPSETKIWEAVLTQLVDGTMPPEDQQQPGRDDATPVIRWIRETLSSAAAGLPAQEMIYPENGNHVPHELLFATDSQAVPATHARIWRVRPSIYETFIEHASREHFHHPFRRESLYSTPWGIEGNGFKDYSALYWIGEAETELLISNAMRAAEMMSRKREQLRGHLPPRTDKFTSTNEKERLQTQFELAATSLIAGLTNVVTICSGLCNPNGNMRGMGVNIGLHQVGHREGEGDRDYRQLYTLLRKQHLEFIAGLVKRLEAVPEGAGTMMDNTVIVYTSDAAETHHSTGNEWPFVLVGNLGGRLRCERFIEYPAFGDHGNRSINALYCSLLHAAGKPREHFNLEGTTKEVDKPGPLGEILS